MPPDIATNQDQDHLTLLGIFHYIAAVLEAAWGCFPLFYVGFGVAMLSGAFDGGNGPPPPPFLGVIMVVAGCIGVFFSWTLATLKFLAARWLHRYCYYRFCIVVAALDCLNMPLGTILGVFTILVLARPSVRARFEGMAEHDRRLEAFDDDEREGDTDRALPPPKNSDDGEFSEGPSASKPS